MPNDPLMLDSEELTVWVMDLNRGKTESAEVICRKVVARVDALTRSMFRQYSRVGRFVDVEDVVQNTMIRLLNACRKVRPTSRRHFYALTSELIRRELLDLTKHYFGKRGHGTNLAVVPVGDGAREYHPTDRTPDLGELDLSTEFHEAVAELPDEEREVFGLIYYHGWTQTQIANLLHVCTRTVQRRQDSAVARLRCDLANGKRC